MTPTRTARASSAVVAPALPTRAPIRPPAAAASGEAPPPSFLRARGPARSTTGAERFACGGHSAFLGHAYCSVTLPICPGLAHARGLLAALGLTALVLVALAGCDAVADPVDPALTFALYEPRTDAVAFFGFSDELGLLWGEVHQGPSFRLSRVERLPGDSVALAWSDAYWPPGGSTVESEEGTAAFDSLWRTVQPPPPPPPAHRGI